MQLGETIATYDVALALRGETGKFNVTSPTGEVYHVTCEPNHSIANLEWAGNRTDPQPFLICKIAEPVSSDQGRANVSALESAQAKQLAAPFLLDNQLAEEKPLKSVTELPKAGTTPLAAMEAAGMLLFFSDDDSPAKNPSACVRLKLESMGRTTQVSLTAICETFNELDAEIRRLHAELDAIRHEAKKRFYKTQANAMSA
jgi:hypothetical protein